MNMKMNMEPIWSILKMIGYFLMELLVWIGTVLLHVTTFLLLFFVLRKVKNKPKIKNIIMRKLEFDGIIGAIDEKNQ